MSAINPKELEQHISGLPASTILGPQQKAMLSTFLTKTEMASIEGNCTVEQLVDVVSRYPGLFDAVIKSAMTGTDQSLAARAPATGSSPGVNPYGGVSFNAYRENYVKNNQDEIAKRHHNLQKLREDIRLIAESAPPGLEEETLDPNVDSFVLAQFMVKLWRLINVIACMFPDDSEPAVLLNIIENTIVPKRESWDFVANEYYDVMSLIFDDIDDAIRFHEEGRLVNYDFLEKVSSHPLFKQLDVRGKISSPRLKPSSRRNLLMTLKHMNAFVILNKHLDASFFLGVQKFGHRIAAEGRLHEVNDILSPDRLLEAAQYGKVILGRLDPKPLFALLNDRALWKRVSDSLRIVSDVPQLSNLKYFIPVLNKTIEEAPEGYYI